MNDAEKADLKRRLMRFLDDAAKDMTGNPDSGRVYFFNVTSRIAIVVAWIPGYENEPENKYVNDEYGLEASIRLRGSSYFVEDWTYISEGCMISIGESDEKESFFSIAKWLVETMDQCDYLDPHVYVSLPDARIIDVLDESYWVSQDDELRDKKEDLTELYWRYHGWPDNNDVNDEIRLWCEHLANHFGSYDEDFQQLISYDDLVELIYQAIIKED